MDPIITGLATGLATTLVTSIGYAIIRRFRLTTKGDADIAEIKEELGSLALGQKMTFKMLLPLMLAQKGGKPNGELSEALKLYNEYMQEK